MEKLPEQDDIWEDTFSQPAEWCQVLHVGTDHVLVQRRFGIGRYPLPDFTTGKRFRFIMVEQSEEASA